MCNNVPSGYPHVERLDAPAGHPLGGVMTLLVERGFRRLTDDMAFAVDAAVCNNMHIVVAAQTERSALAAIDCILDYICAEDDPETDLAAAVPAGTA